MFVFSTVMVYYLQYLVFWMLEYQLVLLKVEKECDKYEAK